MSKLLDYFRKNSIYENLFMLTGVLMQVVIFFLTNAAVLSLVSGVCGVIAVILCAQKKISQFAWSFVQLGTYMYLAYQQRFYGELFENVFYIITMIWGVFIWYRNYDTDADEVITKQLTAQWRVVVSCLMLVCGFFLYLFLRTTDDTQPLMDVCSTVPAFFAQILFVLRFKENWYCWLIIDVTSIFMWTIAGDYIMAFQFLFWSINCLYGMYKWNS